MPGGLLLFPRSAPEATQSGPVGPHHEAEAQDQVRPLDGSPNIFSCQIVIGAWEAGANTAASIASARRHGGRWERCGERYGLHAGNPPVPPRIGVLPAPSGLIAHMPPSWSAVDAQSKAI